MKEIFLPLIAAAALLVACTKETPAKVTGVKVDVSWTQTLKGYATETSEPVGIPCNCEILSASNQIAGQCLDPQGKTYVLNYTKFPVCDTVFVSFKTDCPSSLHHVEYGYLLPAKSTSSYDDGTSRASDGVSSKTIDVNKKATPSAYKTEILNNIIVALIIVVDNNGQVTMY